MRKINKEIKRTLWNFILTSYKIEKKIMNIAGAYHKKYEIINISVKK